MGLDELEARAEEIDAAMPSDPGVELDSGESPTGACGIT